MARPARLVANTTVGLPEVSSDFRTFTLRIRPGIWFQDDPAFRGRRRELVAEDYVYSIKRVFDPRWKSQMLFELEPAKIVGIDEIRKRALKGRPFDYATPIGGRARARSLHAADPACRALAPLRQHADAGHAAGAVAREVVELYGDDIMAHPVGTGPVPARALDAHVAHRARAQPDLSRRDVGLRDAEATARAGADVARLRGRKVPLVDRVEVTIIEESQPRWLSFDQGALDQLAVPFDYVPIAAPLRALAPHLARRRVRLQSSSLPDVTLSYFNMEHPVVGGYAPAKVALRRAISLAFDSSRYRPRDLSRQRAAAASPGVPDTFGYDPACRPNCPSSARPAPRRCSRSTATSTATATAGASSPTALRWCSRWHPPLRNSIVGRTSSGNAAWTRSG